MMLYYLQPSLLCLSKKTYVPLAFHLRLGGVLWPVFLFRNKYDAEVMFCLLFGYDMGM